ncbi:SDR family NAD(P)-dependent oxidoreductase [Sphingobium sp. EM0848]|uniref:SDR family NAD(P)-dependent oxidoreductase n=1 Tax=Sphingobium sp. EM0848 TaxID=2743473 RepID=UPI00159C46A0|nr:glucose 1-dehydrogenase [Sphingobium sp. EM0848]
MNRLHNKVAIITGGARGMGAATSRLFVAEGAKVAIADLLDEAGEALAAELGDAARFYHHDVTSEEGWANLVAAVEADLGPVDILVNNAGILLFRTLLDTTLEDYEKVLNVNLVGEFLGIKAVAPGMIARGNGSIVNISSVDGMKGANGLAAYSSSKWGVRGLTRVAALELGHRGVRVNSVHPGGVDTVMTNHEGRSRDSVSERFRNIPLQRVGGPEEVAKATLFLASDDASYLAGAEIAVDGGMLTGHYYEGLPGAPGVSS